jgi:hypothetical protein
MDDKNRRPLSSVVATFALPPSPPGQDEFKKLTPKRINRCTRRQGEAVASLESPVPGVALTKLRRPRPTHTQARRFICVLVFMFGSAQHERVLTLIQPGEVKIDLANFDVKFRTKFLYVRLFFI